MLLPMGRSDDMAHSQVRKRRRDGEMAHKLIFQNEKLDVYNYINGMKMFAAYLFECAKVFK
jgi:hypothetical protein